MQMNDLAYHLNEQICSVNPIVFEMLSSLGKRIYFPSKGILSQSAEAHKLAKNFTWWVNRKDADGNNVFQGGFLGLDNIGVFDRSAPLPTGGHLDQADGTAWMALYCQNMLQIALELAQAAADVVVHRHGVPLLRVTRVPPRHAARRRDVHRARELSDVRRLYGRHRRLSRRSRNICREH